MEDILDTIRQKISLIDVISRVVSLAPKGREYTGCCPFHSEKTPSFFVNPYKGFYYCFGCGAKGNIFSFYCNYYHLSFVEALNQIATDWGIELPKNVNYKSFEVNRSLESINKNFLDYCVSNLSKNEKVKKYLLDRCLSKIIIKKFDIGYSEEYGENDIIRSGSIPYEDILELGLLSVSKKGYLYPTFKNRIIFPIRDISGKILGFGGRVLDDSLPKYLNSKDSKLFSKRKILYGLYQALSSLKNSELIVVEGYMDVISLHQAGFTTAVACLGTSITLEHLELIHKYSTNPVFCLDGDNAGIKALNRLLDLYLDYLKPGMNPKFIILPDKEDPDSFIKNNSVDAFKKYIKNAKGVSETFFDIYRQNKDLRLPEDNAEVLHLLKQKAFLVKNIEIRQSMLSFFRNVLHNARYKESKKYVKKSYNPVINIQVEEERAYLLFAILLKTPELFYDIEEEFVTLSFKDVSLNNIKNLLVNIFSLKTDNSVLKKLLLEDSRISQLKSIINNSNIINPVTKHIKTKDDALELFKSTYNLLRANFLDSKVKEINKTVLKLYRDIYNNNNDIEVKNIKTKIEVYLKQTKDIKNEIERLKEAI